MRVAYFYYLLESYMSFLNKSAAAFALTAAAAATSAAFAAGFQLTEQSSLGLGRAYAGAGIVGDDLSAVHYNPAGMTLLSGTRFQAGGVWIEVDAPIKTASDSENGRLKGQMIPAGYTTHQVNDSLWLGFGMTVPFGMGTQYSKDWEGTSRGNESMILTFDMNPSFAWKVSEFISVGGGVSVQYAKAKLGLGLDGSMMDQKYAGYNLGNAKLEADSWDWGYNLGVMISPSDKLRFGLSYRSSIEHNAEGTMKFSNTKPLPGNSLVALEGFTFSSKATVETPDTVMLTGTWEATDSLRLSGLVRWANWSNFKNLVVDNEVPAFVAEAIGKVSPDAAGKIAKHEIQNDWEDTWLFSVGADYAVNSNWTVRGGIAYEKDPIADQTRRMAVIPDTDRLWLTLGSTYKYNDQLQFDVGAAYLRGIGNKDLYYPTPKGMAKAEYDSLDAYLVGVQMQYRF